MHGVSPLLSRTLRWQGPVGWAEFLEEQRAHTTQRHARIDELLRRLDQGARESGVAAVALKGAALHAMGLYAAGDRPMADIDLLVRPGDVEVPAQMLNRWVFVRPRRPGRSGNSLRLTITDPASLARTADNSVKIELHERICERLPWRITDMSERIFPPHLQPGLNGYPSKASMMIHLLLHAAGSMTTRALRLLHLHDLRDCSSRE